MLTNLEDNLVKIFENSFKEHWSLDAITDYGTTTTYTYGEMALCVAQMHLLFEHCGINKGDKIALMGKNNCRWVMTYLATITYGAVVVPILQDFKPNDTVHLINHSESKMLFISDRIWEEIEADQIPDVVYVGSLESRKMLLCRLHNAHSMDDEHLGQLFNKRYPNGFHKQDVHYDERSNAEMVSINYTSGTTGFSKGVMTTANALSGHLHFFRSTGLLYRGGRQLAFLPLAHAFGCVVDMLGNLSVGGHTWLMGRTPAPKVIMKAFAEVKPTLIVTVPLILEKVYRKMIAPQISKAPVSWVLKVPLLDELVLQKIRAKLIDAFGGEFEEVIIGGAPLNAEVEAFLKRINFPYTVGYGMTETAPIISYTPYKWYRTFSCGKVLELMQVRIDRPNKEGVGEIQVRGEHMMLGYYKNEEATKQVFTKDGWLKTGDLGMIDEDGFVYIKGRNKTMLLGPSGQNIYPEEIEAKLNNMPYVLESLVLQKDTQLIALVCPDYDMVDANHLSHSQLEQAMEQNRKTLNSDLAAYEVVSSIQLYPHEFEKTPKKSIKRFLYTSMV